MALVIGPYTISRGAILPLEAESETDQIVNVDGDGGVVVTETTYHEQFLKMNIRGTLEEMEAIKGFIENGVRFRAVPFNVTDEWNNTYYVRFWNKKASWKLVAPGICEMDLLLRKEI